MLLVLIALRILSFSEYALDSSIQAARRRLTTTIYEKDEVCDRFAKLLVSIQNFPKGILHGSLPTRHQADGTRTRRGSACMHEGDK